ncbi:MAG TPA: ABC transporter permease [Saprospiraceae bacterium]|nr:ABC transporter permease [Saprospiraceae bacterium]HMQ84348.1 ABC transporter permease [Saprospiraceae bacterium]
MLQNYLKTAWRHLIRHKTFSFINVFGLAISMSICMLIITLIKDAYSYDLFHPNREQIYRIITDAQRKNGSAESYASSPFAVGQTLANDYPQAEIWTPLINAFHGAIRFNEHSFDFSGFFTDASFFDLFGFELEAGDEATALTEPYAIVLENELAHRLFPNESALGKIVEIPGYEATFKVSGVLKPFPGKTHLEFTALASLATQLAREKQANAPMITSNWNNYYTSYNFIRLKHSKDLASAELALAQIAKDKYKDLELESRDAGYQFYLQPLDEITPSGIFSNSMGRGMPIFLILFLSVLGALIILSACFNYTNLTIARSLVRTKEVGVRKVLGASRWQVMGQFIGESVVTAMIALLLAYPLLQFIKPRIAQLSIAEAMDMRLKEDLSLYLFFVGFTVFVGMLAGILPAITLSKSEPLGIFQQFQNHKLIQRIGLRKVLLTIQFVFTLIFFITMTISWRQVSHAIVHNFGFNQAQTLVVELQGQPYSKVVPAFEQLSGVELISGISHSMGTWADFYDDVRLDISQERKGVRQYFIDHHYLEHFGISLIAGQNFPENLSQQQELFAIANETFIQDFELGDPAEAIGKSLLLGDSTTVIIRGVVPDFPFKPAVYAMEPLLLRYQPDELALLNVKLAGGNLPEKMIALESIWKKLQTGEPFDAQFFDQKVRDNYAELLDMTKIVGFFGFMGLLIACMGLLGMTIYTAETKSKEISIRKVMGASISDIVLMLSKNYFVLLGIAVAIASPIAFFVGNLVLQTFAQRINWSPGLFLPGILILLLIAGITVGSQALRAAIRNPVESLRSE